jgi:hypothetical protein
MSYFRMSFDADGECGGLVPDIDVNMARYGGAQTVDDGDEEGEDDVC